MGSTISAEQDRLLVDHFSQVQIMLDGDNAGRQGSEKISFFGKLSPFAICHRCDNTELKRTKRYLIAIPGGIRANNR
jgi:hypothetical protein